MLDTGFWSIGKGSCIDVVGDSWLIPGERIYDYDIDIPLNMKGVK